MAVGATPANVMSVIVRQSARLVLAGVAVGVPLAAAASWVVRSQLHGVEPGDPLVLGAASAVIVLAAALASIAPAARALRIDPVEALRHE